MLTHNASCIAPQHFSADTFEMLFRILERWCEDKALPIDHPQAEAAGAELVDLYQFGVDEPALLYEMIQTL